VARLPIENGYLFVHLPKTAGTSFRDSLADIFADGLYCDYGFEEDTTTPIVKDYIYQRQEFVEFASFLADLKKPVCISGHYPIRKYAPFFVIKNVMLFLRNPVQRTISQYEHMRRVDGLQESMESFCSKPMYMNLQTRNIGRAPLNLIGFVGLQEYYSESLQLLAFQNGLQIKESFLNVNEKRSTEKYKLDEETLGLIRRNNDKDLALYKMAKKMFLQRYEFFSAGKTYMHAAVTQQNSNKVAGWVLNHNSDLPVKIAIYVDGVERAQLRADVYRHDLREWNVGRQGYVGFEFTFKKPLAEHSHVECVVLETGQQIYNPFAVAKS
jgi:hypothetical protein